MVADQKDQSEVGFKPAQNTNQPEQNNQEVDPSLFRDSPPTASNGASAMADMYCESERDQTNDPVILPPTDIGSNNNDTDLP